MAIMQMSRHGIKKQRELQWVMEQFHREPWDTQRFQRIADSERWITECFPKLAEVALNGSAERYAWLLKLVQRDNASQYSYPLRSLLVSPEIQVNEKNVDRIVELRPFCGIGRHTYFNKMRTLLATQTFRLSSQSFTRYLGTSGADEPTC